MTGEALPAFIDTVRRYGRDWSLFSDGTLLPVIRGGDGPTDPPTPPADPPTPPSPPADPPTPPTDPPAPPAPTAADVNRAKGESKKAALEDVAKQLGCTIEEAKTIVEAHRAAEDAKKDDATKAREEADREKAEAENERKAATRDRLAVRVERALLAAGVPVPKDDLKEGEKSLLERASIQVMAEVGDADEADDERLKAAVTQLKTDVPAFFTPSTTGTAPDGTPLPPPPGTPPAKSGVEAGREKARVDREEREKRTQFMEGLTPLGQRAAS